MKKILTAFLVLAPIAAFADDAHIIVQQGRAFRPGEITINKGEALTFTNDDDFIHQIYVKSDTFNIDTAESYPGNTLPVMFTKRGTFEVHCHIHPKMGLVVTVK